MGPAVVPEMAPAFIASYWTLAGQVLPRSPSQVSPHPFEERVRAAAQAGYSGIGLMHDDLQATVQRLGFGRMRRLLADHGIVHLELEFLADWFADGVRRQRSDEVRSLLLEAARELGARHIKTGGDRDGVRWPAARMAEDFQALCEAAARQGTRIALELLPWSNLATPAEGLDLLRRAPAGSAGLLLDIWHLQRASVSWSELRALPPGSVIAVELCDAQQHCVGSLWDDTIRRRQPCGEGEFDLPGFLEAVAASGFRGPFGIEIISDAQRALPLAQAATVAIEGARRFAL